MAMPATLDRVSSTQGLYGLDKELALKAAAKFDPQLAYDALKWVESTIKEKLPTYDFWEALRSGLVLCKLANSIRPGVIEKINDKPINGSIALMERDNIKLYLAACQKLGVGPNDMFIIADLHDGKYLSSVLGNIIAVRERAKTEKKLREHMNQRKARKLPITSETSLDDMLSLLITREGSAIDANAARAQIRAFKAQRIKTCGHLLKIYRRKEYWSQLEFDASVKKNFEDVMFDLDLDPSGNQEEEMSYSLDGSMRRIPTVESGTETKPLMASSPHEPPRHVNDADDRGCTCSIM